MRGISAARVFFARSVGFSLIYRGEAEEGAVIQNDYRRTSDV